MSSLRNSYHNISNSNNFHVPAGAGETLTAIDSVTIGVPADKSFWTVSVVGSDTDYQVSVKAVGQTEYRDIENGLIDGTTGGRVAYFRGNIDSIRITQVGASGQEFQYSLVGSNNS